VWDDRRAARIRGGSGNRHKDVNSVKKSRFAAAVTAGALALPLAIVPAAAEAHPWPPTAKKAFVSSCTKAGAPRGVCVKAMRCVKRKVTVGQLAQVTSNKRVERKVNRIAQQCTIKAIS
jgi:hypothetical protein